MISTKLIIVGGGPAGLTAGIYAARAGLKPIIISGSIPGGQLMITTEVENFPGFPDDISGPELIHKLQQQALKFGATIISEMATGFKFHKTDKSTCVSCSLQMYDKQTHCTCSQRPHRLYVGDQLYGADAIILANGASARWLNANDEKLYINNGISACATCDGPLPCFRDKKIYVIGGGDSAAEEALFLTKFASKVYVVHRRDKLRASKIMADRVLSHPKIQVLWNTTVEGYTGNDDGFLNGIIVKNESGLELNNCTGVFMAIGHDPNTKELIDTGIDMDEKGYIISKDNVFTNIEGVFVAGDCADKVYKQAITASGFGCMASISAERWLENNI